MLAAALLVACSSDPTPLADAAADAADPADAGVDAARACAGIPIWQALYACRTPAEGDAVCVYVMVDMTGVITDVTLDVDHPETPEVVACVRAMMVGHCDPSVVESNVICVYGV